jgi:hypothetical protein
MAREPSYPEEAPVGSVQDEAAADKADEGNRKRHLMTGAAIGIGSAALVAALLYANRSRKGGSGKDE